MPSADLTFAFAASSRPWPTRWGRHITDHGPGRLVDNVAERRGLQRSPCRVLVVDSDSPIIDTAEVDALRSRGVAVIAVWDAVDPETKALGVGLGADGMIEADAGAEELVDLALDVANGWDAPAPEKGSVLGDELRDVDQAWPNGAPHVHAGARRLVVGGPVGDDPEEVTLALAAVLAGRGERVVVIDANDVTPCVTQRLGLPVLPNIRIAVEAVRERGLCLTDSLLAVPEGGFWVLGGLADVRQWAEVSPAEVGDVVDELAAMCDVVVVQAGPFAEDLGDAGIGRFAITRSVLAGADGIVAVGAASPTGIARLVAWTADVRLLAPRTRLDVVLTRAPKDRFRRDELVQRLNSDLQPASVIPVTTDPRLEAAAWDGRLLNRGPLIEAMVSLSASIPSSGAPSRRLTGGARRG